MRKKEEILLKKFWTDKSVNKTKRKQKPQNPEIKIRSKDILDDGIYSKISITPQCINILNIRVVVLDKTQIHVQMI